MANSYSFRIWQAIMPSIPFFHPCTIFTSIPKHNPDLSGPDRLSQTYGVVLGLKLSVNQLLVMLSFTCYILFSCCDDKSPPAVCASPCQSQQPPQLQLWCLWTSTRQAAPSLWLPAEIQPNLWRLLIRIWKTHAKHHVWQGRHLSQH